MLLSDSHSSTRHSAEDNNLEKPTILPYLLVHQNLKCVCVNLCRLLGACVCVCVPVIQCDPQ